MQWGKCRMCHRCDVLLRHLTDEAGLESVVRCYECIDRCADLTMEQPTTIPDVPLANDAVTDRKRCHADGQGDVDALSPCPEQTSKRKCAVPSDAVVHGDAPVPLADEREQPAPCPSQLATAAAHVEVDPSKKLWAAQPGEQDLGLQVTLDSDSYDTPTKFSVVL